MQCSLANYLELPPIFEFQRRRFASVWTFSRPTLGPVEMVATAFEALDGREFSEDQKEEGSELIYKSGSSPNTSAEQS